MHITFDAWSLTDYERRWGMKPWMYFLKAVIHKYIYKFPYEEGTIVEVAADTAYVYAQIKNYCVPMKEKKRTVPKRKKCGRKLKKRC